MKYLFKINLIISIFLIIFSLAPSTNAVNCGSQNIIGNSPPYWGTDANQNVSLSKGTNVRVTVKGEDGCVAQFAEFQIFRGSSLIKSITTQLIWQNSVSGQSNAKFLGGDWIVDLDPGTYSVKLLKVGNIIYSSNLSSNALTVGTSQACNLDKVYANPNGGKPGEKIKATVEAKGSCQGWGATININRTTGGTNVTVLNGSEQKFPSGSNKLEWQWTLPALTAGSSQASYKIVARLGSQNLESQTFITSPGAGGPVPGPGGPVPGGDVDVSFEIPNPIQAESLVDLAKAIGKFLFQIAIPIAVIVIIYAGFLYLKSGGNKEKVATAHKALWYAVIGLAVILIGQGFFTLIKSILNLGG